MSAPPHTPVRGEGPFIPRPNNFDLVRLLAALQVLFIHIDDHLGVAVPDLITFFPGVPIFFIVSGFLVTASLARSESLAQYARNRALRIYPALWCMTGVTLVLLACLGHLNASVDLSRLALYVLGQMSFFQVVNGGLGLFPRFGTGGVNGVLWTIATELQFYVILPIVLLMVGAARGRRTVVLGVLFAASLAVYWWIVPIFATGGLAQTSSTQRYATILIYTSVIPHLFGFLIGIFAYFAFATVHKLVAGRFFIWAALYAAFALIVGRGFGIAGWTLEMNLPLMLFERVLLALLVFSIAFSFPTLTERVLKGNDISYGVYIYQMLIINSLIDFRLVASWWYATLALVLTLILATLSWRYVERPVLRMKLPHRRLNPARLDSAHG